MKERREMVRVEVNRVGGMDFMMGMIAKFESEVTGVEDNEKNSSVDEGDDKCNDDLGALNV